MNFPIASNDDTLKSKLNLSGENVTEKGNLNPQNISFIESVQQNVAELLAEIGAKRNQDVELLKKFKQELEAGVENLYKDVEKLMNEEFTMNNIVLETKAEEILKVLARIDNLETDLEEYRQAVASFLENLQNIE